MSTFRGFQPGDRLEGRYEILDTIGQGGFGVVYRARQIAIDRVVAVKVLLPEADEVDPQAVERFKREAMLISSLESPNTITLYEFGQTNDGLLYTVMEYARGETLRQLIANEGRLPANRVVRIAQQVLASLHEAHQRGVIHRDLKPANIMVGEFAGKHDHVKVLDFGIAKVLKSGDTQSTLMLTGRIVGTPRYMAPEQLRGANPTPAADLYALGLIMYEMLTGRPAVEATEPMQQVQAQMATEPFHLGTLPGVPPGLIANVNKALNKEPLTRFQSADEFARALETSDRISVPSRERDEEATRKWDGAAVGDALEAEGERRRRAAAAAATAQQRPTSAPYPEVTQDAPRSGLGVYIGLAAVLFILALGGLAFLLITSGGGGGETADTGVVGAADAGVGQVEDLAGMVADIQVTPPAIDMGVASVDLSAVATPDTGAATPPEADMGAATPPEVDAGTTVEADTGAQTPPEADAGAQTPPEVDAGTTAEADTGAQTPPEADTGTTVETDTGAATPPEVDAGTTAEADTGAATPPEVDAGTAPEEDTGPQIAAIDEDTGPPPAAAVSVAITSDPVGARVTGEPGIDCRTPCSIDVPSGGSVEVRVRASGYHTGRETVRADAGTVHVALRRRSSGGEGEEEGGTTIAPID
jgi:hypothetical protein